MGTWMDSSCIDLYLMKYWLDHQESAQVIYIPMRYYSSLRQEDGLGAEEKESLFCFMGYQRDEEVEDEEHIKTNIYAAVIFEHSHFFTVTLNYADQSVHVYGRYISFNNRYEGWTELDKNQLWVNGDSWMGMQMYKNLGLAMSMTDLDGTPSCHTVNWIQVNESRYTMEQAIDSLMFMPIFIFQNGRDCGATVVSTMTRLITDGPSYNVRNGTPLNLHHNAECAHIIRTKMLCCLAEQINDSYRWSQRLGMMSYMDGIQDVLEVGISEHHKIPLLITDLERSAQLCEDCQRKREDMRVQGTNADYKSNDFDEEGDEERDGEGEEEEEENEEEDRSARTVAAFTRQFPHLRRAGLKIRGTDIKARTLVKGIKMIPLKTQRFQVVRRNRCLDFDDYFNGPTVEDQKQFKTDGEGWEPGLIYGPHKPAFRSAGELFIDWGYRLLPEFAQMFANSQPQKFTEHCFPQIANVSQGSSRFEEEEELDVTVMGMEEMIDIVKDHPIWLVDVFVKGQIPTSEGPLFIKLDCDKDNLWNSVCNEVTIKTSIDIDSIIVVMRRLAISADIEVSMLPTGASKPPLSKSNHTWVHLLHPQSEMDQGTGERHEWFETRHSPSQIPHMHFGKVDGLFDMLIMFPRMKHKHPVTGKSATLIPWEIQNEFFVEILYPAMAFVSDEAREPYVDYEMETWRWKSASKYGFKKTVVVQHGQLERLQNAMEDIIRAESELSKFGSFFFLMDAKGIKLRTMTMDSDVNVLEVLQEKFSCINFDMLSRRDVGQVLVDLGLGYHATATTTDDEPEEVKVTCLWDLDRLDQIYTSAGFNKGTLHHANTMGFFGGRQSEMRADRAPLVHLCFRSSYGLYYEPFRKVKGGDIPFCDDWDAYRTNQAFLDSIQNYQRLMKEAQGKSLGVRDELRGSLTAIRELLKDLPRLVRKE